MERKYTKKEMFDLINALDGIRINNEAIENFKNFVESREYFYEGEIIHYLKNNLKPRKFYIPSKEELEEESKKKSLRELAICYNTRTKTIQKWLMKEGIKKEYERSNLTRFLIEYAKSR